MNEGHTRLTSAIGLLFFAAPKQSATRELRIEKSIPRILDGMGLND